MVKHWKRVVLGGLVVTSLHLSLANLSAADEKITYQDQVSTIFRNNCFKCHSQDTSKADLDLSSFSAALRGGSSGPCLQSGDPTGSKLFNVLAQTEEPTMPPKTKISDKELEIIRKWIAGGLLDGSGSKAIISSAPKVDLAVDASKLGKPDGPPALPQDWLLEPVVHTEHKTAVIGMAASPWAPVVALTGQHQVLLYNTDTLELSGLVKFTDGHPAEVHFSRNGKLLLAAGGEGAKLGYATVWDVVTGEKIIRVGEEYDTVLASDISADQKWIVLGGPSKLVKIYSTADGQQKFSLKKHTDWITAAEFSPDGKYLATGDRVGGIFVWEPSTGTALYTLRGHRGSITQLSWRPDGALLLSVSEDGTAKTWKVDEEKQVKSWTAHGGGVVSGCFAQDGNIVTAGRDKRVTLWDGNGGKKRSFNVTEDIPVRAVLSNDGKRVIASDWVGNVHVWNAADGKVVGEINANPLPVSTRLETAQKEADDATAAVEKLTADLAAAKAELASVESQQSNKNALDAAKKKISDINAALVGASTLVESKKLKVAELQAAQFNIKVYSAKEALEAKELAHQKLLASIEDAKSTVESATHNITKTKKQIVYVSDRLDGLKNVSRYDKRFADEAKDKLKDATKAAAKLSSKIAKKEKALAKAKPDSQENLKKEIAEMKKELEPLQKHVTECEAEMAKCEKEIDSTKQQFAKVEKEGTDVEKKLKTLTSSLRQAQGEVSTAQSRVEKSKKELEAEKLKVESMVAEYKKMKPKSDSPQTAKL